MKPSVALATATMSPATAPATVVSVSAAAVVSVLAESLPHAANEMLATHRGESHALRGAQAARRAARVWRRSGAT